MSSSAEVGVVAASAEEAAVMTASTARWQRLPPSGGAHRPLRRDEEVRRAEVDKHRREAAAQAAPYVAYATGSPPPYAAARGLRRRLRPSTMMRTTQIRGASSAPRTLSRGQRRKSWRWRRRWPRRPRRRPSAAPRCAPLRSSRRGRPPAPRGWRTGWRRPPTFSFPRRLY
jgi:hypothetical protein